MRNPNTLMAIQIAEKAAKIGGRAYYVGGYVRDKLLHRENKDIDMEVHGLFPAQLEELLESLGERTMMGVSFGVYGLKHYDIDIAMPRRETANGRGHRDFTIYVDPFLGIEKAAGRRDFTMNAMLEDILTGELLDPFHGRDDLQAGILRHVNEQSFGEDPLRVLRAAQFAARFQCRIAPETVQLCQTMDIAALAKERVFGELQKALLKADKPSIFFSVLRDMKQLAVWFPELMQMIGVEQNPDFHKEGDVWNHTMLTIDAAAELREKAQYALGFMMAALCHDMGKPVSTTVINGRIRSLGHETAGLPIVTDFLTRISNETKLKRYVLNMTELHMRPNIMAGQHSGRKAMTKLFDQSICPEDLLLLAKADRMGQIKEGSYREKEEFLQEQLTLFHERMAQPYVKGADLVAQGFSPCAAFHEALTYAHKLRLVGIPKEEALKQTTAYLKQLQKKTIHVMNDDKT